MSQLLLPLAILTSSFLGSWHCAGMCGPFAALTGSRGQLWHYHLGRLLVYASLGVLAGFFGDFVMSSEFGWVRMIGAVLLGFTLIALGLQYLFAFDWGKRSHFFAATFFQNLYRRLRAWKFGRSSFVIGLLAGLLPCMWLYTYVIAASASKSPFAGGLLMVLFWLGGLPALSAVSLMVRPSMLKSNIRKQRIAGGVLVVSGLYALGSHWLF
ncbi:MAG: sulfite exporter TauE/SafE family protein [Bdellovibrionales bacterium]|nr:sulfite exporter TauE/SafE family protein [Bdellovibrionales bacterium]